MRAQRIELDFLKREGLVINAGARGVIHEFNLIVTDLGKDTIFNNGATYLRIDSEKPLSHTELESIKRFNRLPEKNRLFIKTIQDLLIKLQNRDMYRDARDGASRKIVEMSHWWKRFKESVKQVGAIFFSLSILLSLPITALGIAGIAGQVGGTLAPFVLLLLPAAVLLIMIISLVSMSMVSNKNIRQTRLEKATEYMNIEEASIKNLSTNVLELQKAFEQLPPALFESVVKSDKPAPTSTDQAPGMQIQTSLVKQ